jgi:hypothetical protein
MMSCTSTYRWRAFYYFVWTYLLGEWHSNSSRTDHIARNVMQQQLHHPPPTSPRHDPIHDRFTTLSLEDILDEMIVKQKQSARDIFNHPQMYQNNARNGHCTRVDTHGKRKTSVYGLVVWYRSELQGRLGRRNSQKKVKFVKRWWIDFIRCLDSQRTASGHCGTQTMARQFKLYNGSTTTTFGISWHGPNQSWIYCSVFSSSLLTCCPKLFAALQCLK